MFDLQSESAAGIPVQPGNGKFNNYGEFRKIGGGLTQIVGGSFEFNNMGPESLVNVQAGTLKLGQHQAHGTSLAAIVPMGLCAAIVYAFRGHMDWALVIQLGLGSVAGVILGAKLMMRGPAKRLRQGFGALLLLVGLRLLIWGA